MAASTASSDLLLVAGEASGDLHGAALLRELAECGSAPHVFGLGGDRLRQQGMETVADFSSLSVVGLGEVLRAVPKARRIFKQLLAEVDRRRPRVALLIDFPEFNLRLARQLKKRDIEVIYYVSPQVWAWRRGRLEMIGKNVSKMMVFFDFEVDFYTDHVEVAHVGHPLLDEVPSLPQAWDRVPESGLPQEYTVALLPGSRSSEIDRLVPVLLGAATRLASKQPCRFVVVRAPSVEKSTLESALQHCNLDLSIVCTDRFQAIANSHLALCASGTATLEVGLIGTPMVVVYRVGLASYVMGRALVSVPHISLVNLVLGSGVVDELTQKHADAEGITRTALELMTSRARIDQMRRSFEGLRPALGQPGASRRAAEHVAIALAPQEGTS